MAAALSLVVSACASTGSPPSGTPVDEGEFALRAEDASTIDRPYRLVFDWSLNEPGTRVSGQGVARISPPERVRLDLFTNGGERVAAVALVGGELRLPRSEQAELPSAPFLWGSLGIFRPGETFSPNGGWELGSGVSELRYTGSGGEEIRYRFSGDRIGEMQALRDGRRLEELQLVVREDELFPQEAVYRHLGDVRELRISLESVENVESYPTDIWDPGA